MENSELLPCPFCGSTPISHKHLPDRVSCQNTSCWICKTYIAIDDWNTRTQPRVTVEEVAVWLYNRYEPHPVGWQNQTEMVRQAYLSDAKALKVAYPHLFKE